MDSWVGELSQCKIFELEDSKVMYRFAAITDWAMEIHSYRFLWLWSCSAEVADAFYQERVLWKLPPPLL